MLKRLSLLAALAIVLAMAVAPAPAQADEGDRSTTKAMSNMTFSVGGVVRSELRNGSVVFWKNIIDGSRWIVVKAQIRDRSTDGWCAKARYLSGWGPDAWGTECNAVWKNFNATLSDGECLCGHFVEVTLGRGSSSSKSFHDGKSYQKVSAPSGW